MPTITEIETELEQVTIILKASEDWSPTYSKDPETHARLIKQIAKTERDLRKYFRELKERSVKYVNWSAYSMQLLKQKTQKANTILGAAQVDVQIFDPDGDIDNEDTEFSQNIHDNIVGGITIGAQAGENIYKTSLGLGPSSKAILEAAQSRTAQLVGKKVLKDGTVVDNPKAGMSVTDTTRAQIQQSIATSLGMNEDVEQATDRLQSIVGNYDRAQTIAATEGVNAYTSGLMVYGDQSGAEQKSWYTAGAKDDTCLTNESNSPIDINDSFQDVSGNDIDGPPGHPNCNCGLQLHYSDDSTFDGSGDDEDNEDDTGL